jgi:hypothetical protein
MPVKFSTFFGTPHADDLAISNLREGQGQCVCIQFRGGEKYSRINLESPIRLGSLRERVAFTGGLDLDLDPRQRIISRAIKHNSVDRRSSMDHSDYV